jgi:hypothetical protein
MGNMTTLAALDANTRMLEHERAPFIHMAFETGLLVIERGL